MTDHHSEQKHSEGELIELGRKYLREQRVAKDFDVKLMLNRDVIKKLRKTEHCPLIPSFMRRAAKYKIFFILYDIHGLAKACFLRMPRRERDIVIAMFESMVIGSGGRRSSNFDSWLWQNSPLGRVREYQASEAENQEHRSARSHG